MLQWMGGSRRKVTTSRRSTQKRQKQYFEQKKRQQQQSAGAESYADDINLDGKHRKEHRSLDILSFLNLSTTTSDCGSSLPSSYSRMDYHVQKSPRTIIPNAVTPAYIVEVKEANMSGSQQKSVNFGMPSANHQEEIVSPKKNLFSVPHNHDSRANDKKIDDWNAGAEKELSVFDLLVDDGRDGHSGRSPVREAHVAFSVEGLGKVGTETPVHSPKGLGGTPSSDHPSLHWKDGRQHNTSKNFNHVLGDIELKLDEIMQDIEMPASNCASEFSMGLMDSQGNKMHNFYNFKEHVQYDATSGFMDDESPRSASSDEFVYRRENNISGKKWSCQIDESSADVLKYGDNKMSDYCFESPPLLNKSNNSQTTKFHIIESSPEHRKSEIGHEFKHSFGDPLHRRNFYFRDIAGRADWAGCVTEDANDNLSFLSDESCSSSAVRGETTYLTPNARHGSNRRSSNMCGNIECSTDDIRYGSNRASSNTHGNEFNIDDIRHGSNRTCSNSHADIGNEFSMDDIRYGSNRSSSNTYGNIRNEYSMDNIFPDEKWKKDWGDTCNGMDAFGPGKCTRTPTPLKSKQPRNLSSTFQGKLGPSNCWSFEGGCNSVGESSGFSTFSQSKGVKGFNLWTEDCLDGFPVREPLVDSRTSEKWKHGGSVREKSAFCRSFDCGNSPHSPVYTKTSFVPHTRDTSPYSATKGTFPDLSHAAGLRSPDSPAYTNTSFVPNTLDSSPYSATKGTLPDSSHAAGPRFPDSPVYMKTSFVPNTRDSSPYSATKGTFPDLPHAAGLRSPDSPAYTKTSFVPNTLDSSPYSATKGTLPDLSHAAGPRFPDSPVYAKTSFVPNTWDSSPYSATKGTFPDSSHAACPREARETELHDSSGQGSVGENEGTKPDTGERFEPGKEDCIGKGMSFSDSEDSELMDTFLPNVKDHKSKEANNGTPDMVRSLKTTDSAEHTGETSSSVKILDDSENHKDQNGYIHDAEAPLPHQIGTAGINSMSGEEKLLSKVFRSELSTGIDARSGEGKLLSKVFHSDLSMGIDASSGEGKLLSKVLHSDLYTGIDARSGDRELPSKGHSDCIDSSEPVMMMESYVLQFLCVQKVLKEASALNTIKKV